MRINRQIVTLMANQWSPRSIAGLTLWLDASKISGLADAGAVATWLDQSANGYNATQGTAGARPTYKTGIMKGKPVVRFDGGDFLSSNCPATTKPTTLVIVANTSNIALANRALFGSSTNDGLELRHAQTTGAFELLKQNAAAIGNSTGTVAAGTPFILFCTYGSAGAYSFVINNGTAETGTGNQTLTLGTTVIGSNSGADDMFIGDMAELIKYDSVLSAAQLTKLYNYLYAKWI